MDHGPAHRPRQRAVVPCSDAKRPALILRSLLQTEAGQNCRAGIALGPPLQDGSSVATSISPNPRRVYTLGVGLLFPRLSPNRPGRGTHSSPNSCASRMRTRKPILAPGRRELARVHALVVWAYRQAASAGRFTVDIIVVRLLFIIVVAITCFLIEPFGQTRFIDAGVGASIGAAIVLFEWKLRTVSLKRLIGAAIGSFLGICGAYLFALVIRNSIPPGNTQSFLQILVMLLMAYVGLLVGEIGR